jgi:hypothetical protein
MDENPTGEDMERKENMNFGAYNSTHNSPVSVPQNIYVHDVYKIHSSNPNIYQNF